MKFCPDIDIRDGVINGGGWPREIAVERGMIDTPPEHVRTGRYGAINIEVKNGWAQYWRTEDTPAGWKYRLVNSDYRPVVR